MDKEIPGVSPQDDLAAKIAAQVAAAAKSRKRIQEVIEEAAKEAVLLTNEILRLEGILKKANEAAKKSIPDFQQEDFEVSPAVLAIKKAMEDTKAAINSRRKGDGSVAYATAFQGAFCAEKMRSEKEPSEETVRLFMPEVAELAHLKVLDSKEAKRANGGKYPSGAAVFKEVCLVYAGEDSPSRGLVKEFRNLVDRHYAAVKMAAKAEFAAIEKSEELSDDLQAMACGKRGKYRPNIPAHKDKPAGYAVVEVCYTTGGALEVRALDGAGCMAFVKGCAEMELSLPVRERLGGYIVSSQEFTWIPDYMPEKKLSVAKRFQEALRFSLYLFNKAGREENQIGSREVPVAKELAKAHEAAAQNG